MTLEDPSTPALPRAQAFVARHGRRQAWRIAAICARLLAHDRGTARHAPALLLLMDAYRGSYVHALLGPLIDEAHALGPDAFSALEWQRIEVHRLYFLLSKALYGNARDAAIALADSATLPPHERAEALLAQANAVSKLGDLDASAALVATALRGLTGDRSGNARRLRADLHMQWSFCHGRAAHRLDLAEMHAKAALRLARAAGALPLLAAAGRNHLAILGSRQALLDERRAAVEPVLRTLAARRIQTPVTGMLLSNYAFTLASADRVEEGAGAARAAWRLFEAADFPLDATIYFAILEFAFEKAGDAAMAETVRAQWRINEVLDKGRTEPMRFATEKPNSRVSEGYLDISQHRAEVRRQAATMVADDAVTGLPTGAAADRLLDAWRESGAWREPQRASVALLVDLDGFGELNAELGYAMADQLLRGVAERLRALAPTLCARVGADEFLLVHAAALAPGASLDDVAFGIGDQVQAAIARPMPSYAPGVRLSACIAIHVARDAWPASEALRRSLTAALQRSKALGRACMSLTDPSFDWSDLPVL